MKPAGFQFGVSGCATPLLLVQRVSTVYFPGEGGEALEDVGRVRCITPEDVREFGEAMRCIRHKATGM
jgi:hypothetical protein